MPTLSTPRSFAFLIVTPLGRVVPTVATGTLSPTLKFWAPQTICSVSPPPTSTFVNHSFSALGWRSFETIRPITTPSISCPTVSIASTAVPVMSSRSASSAGARSTGTSSRSHFMDTRISCSSS